MLAKRFMYVCAGLLCLALAYHFGAVNATAQAPGNPVAAGFLASSGTGNPVSLAVVTSGGDVYGAPYVEGPWVHYANVFSGPTPVQRETFGSVKVRYRGERGAAQPGRQDK